VLGFGRRRQPGQALVAHRRHREAPHGFDDAVELESPEDSWVHLGDQLL
jgi:hypothetical protein